MTNVIVVGARLEDGVSSCLDLESELVGGEAMLQMRNWAALGAVLPSALSAVPVLLYLVSEPQDAFIALGVLIFSLMYYAPAGALLGAGAGLTVFLLEGWLLRSTPERRFRRLVVSGVAVWLCMSVAVMLFLQYLYVMTGPSGYRLLAEITLCLVLGLLLARVATRGLYRFAQQATA